MIEATAKGVGTRETFPIAASRSRSSTCMPMSKTTTMAAEVLDEVLARRAVPGRPPDLEGDDLAFIRAAAGRGDHPDPRLPVVG
jgi:hypothetical protein